MNGWFASNMFVVNVFAFWEHFHRRKIASLLLLDKNDLQSPIMGDLRYLRNSIVHNNGKANSEIRRCRLLQWYEKGEAIFLDNDRVAEIIYHMKLLVRELNLKYKQHFEE